MDKNKKDEQPPEAYPRPSETDNQLKNQPEYIDQEPNEFKKEISDLGKENENSRARNK